MAVFSLKLVWRKCQYLLQKTQTRQSNQLHTTCKTNCLVAEEIHGHVTLISVVEQKKCVSSTGIRDSFLGYVGSNFCGRYIANFKLITLFYVTLHDARELGR